MEFPTTSKKWTSTKSSGELADVMFSAKQILPKTLLALIALIWLGFSALGQAPKSASSALQTRVITITSEPGAIVWIDDVRYGTTGKDGKLTVKTVARGAHTLRLRADGFKEITRTVTAAQKGEISIPLTKTEDRAELAYQVS